MRLWVEQVLTTTNRKLTESYSVKSLKRENTVKQNERIAFEIPNAGFGLELGDITSFLSLTL